MNIADFIKTFLPDAQAINKSTGIPASAVLAQAYQESNTEGGLSTLASKYNNFFGIKGKGDAGSVWLPTTEYVNNTPTSQLAEFAVFSSPHAGFQGYADTIRNTKLSNGSLRYQSALNAEGDAVKFVQQVAASGYATDPNYASSVASIIKSNNLTQYDTGVDINLGAMPQTGYPGQNTVVGNVFGQPGDKSEQDAYDRMDQVSPPTQIGNQISKAINDGAASLWGIWAPKVAKVVIILVLVIILVVLVIGALPMPQKQIVKGLTGGE